jgi:hypothetical protein
MMKRTSWTISIGLTLLTVGTVLAADNAKAVFKDTRLAGKLTADRVVAGRMPYLYGCREGSRAKKVAQAQLEDPAEYRGRSKARGELLKTNPAPLVTSPLVIDRIVCAIIERTGG